MDNRVNGLYNYPSVIEQAAVSFRRSKPNMLLLKDFLEKDFYNKITDEIKKVNGIERYNLDKEKYSELKIPNILDDFLKSEFFIGLLQETLGKKVSEMNYSLKKFGHGDFSLIHDDEVLGKRIDFFLTFIEGEWKQEWGRYNAYSKGDGEPLIFPAEGNSFCLIIAEGEMFDFVKYVKHFAGKNVIYKLEGRIK